VKAPELVNAERPAGDKPETAAQSKPAQEPTWHGSATSQIEYWRRRALTAEARITKLLEEKK